MKRVLVTGGAGFIGSHVVEQLVEKKYDVVVFDNLSTGSLENLASVEKKITFIHGDIQDSAAIKNACTNVEAIFHLAAQISVAQSLEHPADCFAVNVVGLLNTLNAAVAHKCSRFIFSSSASVYGNRSLCVETDEPKPISPYGHSKLIGEQLCSAYYKQYGLPVVILRYFNLYGKRQKSGVIAALRTSFEANQPVTIYGDGTQTRDFVPVEQVARANVSVAQAPLEKVAGEIFNVATGTSLSLNAVLENLKQEYAHYTAPVVYKPWMPGDIQFSSAVCEKLKMI